MPAHSTTPRADHLWKTFSRVYAKVGGRSSASGDALPARRNSGGSWASARKPARFELSTRGACRITQVSTVAKYATSRTTV